MLQDRPKFFPNQQLSYPKILLVIRFPFVLQFAFFVNHTSLYEI